MYVNREKVEKIANMAHIKLSQEEIILYKKELNDILKWVRQLEEVNTDDVLPLSNTISLSLSTDNDEIKDNTSVDALLKNAPESKYGYFVVPKVIEQES